MSRCKHGLFSTMAKPSALVLIDGSNVYHCLKQEHCLHFGPSKFKALFAALAERFSLKEVLYYDAVRSIAIDPQGYARQQEFHAALRRSCPCLTIRTRKLRYVNVTDDDKIVDAAHKAGICQRCVTLVHAFLRHLGLLRLTKEKGIDVMLVVDALSRAKDVETVVIMSGDADFTPAVHLLKSQGVMTVNVHASLGSSRELRSACHNHLLLRVQDGSVALL